MSHELLSNGQASKVPWGRRKCEYENAYDGLLRQVQPQYFVEEWVGQDLSRDVRHYGDQVDSSYRPWDREHREVRCWF